MTLTLMIDAMRIHLPDTVDLGTLRTTIVAAARSGADFVSVQSVQGVHYDLLITAGSTILLQSADSAVEFGEPFSDWTSTIDLDLDL